MSYEVGRHIDLSHLGAAKPAAEPPVTHRLLPIGSSFIFRQVDQKTKALLVIPVVFA